jgi:hypothetical protein
LEDEPVDQILLSRPTGRRFANIREITGVEEQHINNTTTTDAIALLQQLLVETNDDALAAGEVGELTAWERDRLLAAVYTRHYGPRIDSTMACQSCGAPFDVDFDLPALMENLAPNPKASIEHLGNQLFQLRNVRFRLPTGHDECAVFGLPPEQAEAEILQRCIIDGDRLDAQTAAEIQKAMQALSPVVNLELDARCPECGNEQAVQFDLQRFLLTALVNDRRRLLHEIHILASAYSWSLSEILHLPRSERRGFVTLVDADDALQKTRALG